MIKELSHNRFKERNQCERILYEQEEDIICSYGLYEDITMDCCTPLELSYLLIWEE